MPHLTLSAVGEWVRNISSNRRFAWQLEYGCGPLTWNMNLSAWNTFSLIIPCFHIIVANKDTDTFVKKCYFCIFSFSLVRNFWKLLWNCDLSILWNNITIYYVVTMIMLAKNYKIVLGRSLNANITYIQRVLIPFYQLFAIIK